MNQKKKLWSILLTIPFGIAILTCGIVNYALDQQFTWSILVSGSCVFGYLLLFTLIFGGKHRLLFTYAVICILIIPYLYLVEKIANIFTPQPFLWVTGFGIPISILWLAICGAIALFRKITHANGWIISGISVLAFYFGDRFTNLKVDELAGGGSGSWRLSEQLPMVYTGTAAVLLFVGIILAAIKYVKKSK